MNMDRVSTSSVDTNTIIADNNASKKEYITYKRRFFLLVALFTLNLSNAMVWLTFGPVAYKAAVFYKTDVDTINWLSVVFMIIGIPFGVLATWLIDSIGLRSSVILSAWLNFVGAVLRAVSAIGGISPDAMLPLVFVGQIIAAFAQPFVLFAPTKLSALWFSENERATANMIATMANPLGIMISSITSPYLAKTSSQSDMLLMLGVQCIPAGLAVSMATFGWCSNTPPTAPSSSAEANSEPFLVGLKMLMKNFSYYILALAVGGGIALFSVLTTLLSQILCLWGYPDTFVGTACIASLIGAGFVGSIITGMFVDRTKRFIETTKVCYFFAVAALIVFAVFHNHPNQEILLAFMCGIFGFFGLPVYPIGNELAVETTYPVGEALCSGILFIFGQIQGMVLILVLQSISTPVDNSQYPNNTCTSENPDQPIFDMSIPVYVMVGYAGVVAIIYIIFFRTDYKRLRSENRQATDASDTDDSQGRDADDALGTQETQVLMSDRHEG